VVFDILRALFCVRYNRAQRIQRLRWQLGAVLPEDVRDLLHPSEKEFLKSYSDILGSYMTTVDLDLTVVMLLNCTMCISICEFEFSKGGEVIHRACCNGKVVYHLNS
jgi:hypothetical protein